jgi:hypothetical protein
LIQMTDESKARAMAGLAAVISGVSLIGGAGVSFAFG